MRDAIISLRNLIFFSKNLFLSNYTAVTHDSHDKMLNSCQALMADNNF